MPGASFSASASGLPSAMNSETVAMLVVCRLSTEDQALVEREESAEISTKVSCQRFMEGDQSRLCKHQKSCRIESVMLIFAKTLSGKHDYGAEAI